MAKATTKDSAQFEQDVLTLDTAAVMKKYKMEKQAVYDKRYALKKKLAASAETTAAPKPVSTGKKRGRKPKAKSQEVIAPIEHNAPQEYYPAPALVVPKQAKSTPVIHKPIELNFANFAVKLNGMPQKISVNPETGAIEIDL